MGFGLDSLVLEALWLAGLAAGIYALVHVVRQRPDAFPAVDKLTKPIWLGIIAVSVFVIGLFKVVSFLGLIAVVALGVYLVDVRPRVDEIQRGPRW